MNLDLCFSPSAGWRVHLLQQPPDTILYLFFPMKSDQTFDDAKPDPDRMLIARNWSQQLLQALSTSILSLPLFYFFLFFFYSSKAIYVGFISIMIHLFLMGISSQVWRNSPRVLHCSSWLHFRCTSVSRLWFTATLYDKTRERRYIFPKNFHRKMFMYWRSLRCSC